MNTIIVRLGLFVLAAVLVGGCGQSSAPSDGAAKSTSAAAPAAAPAPPSTPAPSTDAATPAAATAPETPAVPAAAATPAAAANSDTSQSAQVDAAAQFAKAATAESDQVAASVGGELATKAKSLAQSAMTSAGLKTQVNTALQSLSAGKDAAALTTLFQDVKGASLTSQQTQLFKEVGNLASAYVVQRQFGSLAGAQSDVATVVSSLRKGEIAPAVPALQTLSQNAALTSQQKELLATLADKYAPGLKRATDSLKQGLQGLQGLTK